MIAYREILRLTSLGYNTEIISCVYSSRGTVQKLLSVAIKMEIRWPLDDDVTNQVLQSLMYLDRYKKDDNLLVPNCPKIQRELAKKSGYSDIALD